jgi:hypothetical protein
MVDAPATAHRHVRTLTQTLRVRGAPGWATRHTCLIESAPDSALRPVGQLGYLTQRTALLVGRGHEQEEPLTLFGRLLDRRRALELRKWL